MIVPSQRRASVFALAAIAACVGASAAFHYHQLGLTLSHYDARGHLVVARRIFDSITPGWQQVGAVWLPLPHLLNALPIQIDLFYRTGFSAVAISVVAFAVATGAIAWIVTTLTNSKWAGAASAGVFALNPNLLYLQATPMTEPLLIALTLISVAMLMHWCEITTTDTKANLKVRTATDTLADLKVRTSFEPPAPSHLPPAQYVGLAFAAACLTRYEAWPVTVVALLAAALAQWRASNSLRTALERVTSVAVYPAAAVLAFLVFSRIIGGAWFASDFFVRENTAQGHPYESLAEVVWGIRALSGQLLVITSVVGLIVLAAVGLTTRPAALVPLALLATAAVPWLAFLDGHPYRIRYMVPLLAAEAVLAGVATGMSGRFRGIPIAALVLIGAYELRPLDQSAPMVVEAQWDRPNVTARDRVTACLAPNYHGETVMVSMGSLGHYMQDLSRSGFRLRDFLHEGNGDIWLNALIDPRPFVGWMLVEEQAEGGDMLAKQARENPAFLAGFSRVCEAAGLVLYRRNPLHAAEDARRHDNQR